MVVSQIANTLNSVFSELIGDTALIQEDLSNIVDVGRTITSASTFGTDFDNFIGKIVDKVGKSVFVNRTYKSIAPNIMRDSWQYGSLLEKVRVDVADFKNNPSWGKAGSNNKDVSTQSFADLFGAQYPTVTATYFNDAITFETKMSFTQQNLVEAFTSASAMNSFISSIENRIATKMTVATDKLIFMTIANLIAETYKLNRNIINLREDYNLATNKNLTAAEFLMDKDALRYAAGVIMNYKNYIKGISKLYNDGTYATFTPADKLDFVVATQFDTALKTVLLSDTYNKELVDVGNYSVVPYWQASGQADESRMHINVKRASDSTVVNHDGIIAVMFDHDACAVCCEQPTVETQRNAERRHTNAFHQFTARYLNDTAENCIVFTITDDESVPGV